MLLLLLAFVSLVNAAKLPEGTVYCNRKDPNINECTRNAVQQSLPALLNGVKELGIEPLEPFKVEKIVISERQDNDNPMDIDLVLEKTFFTGLKDITVKSAEVDWDGGVLFFEATAPMVDIKGQYYVDGTILILPINGKGNFDCKLHGLKGHVKIHGSEKEQNGEKYFIIDRFAFTFDVENLVINFENLFGGDKMLGDTTNAFLNDNWRSVLDDMKPSIETAFSQHFKEIAAQVFHAVPLKDIALP